MDAQHSATDPVANPAAGAPRCAELAIQREKLKVPYKARCCPGQRAPSHAQRAGARRRNPRACWKGASQACWARTPQGASLASSWGCWQEDTDRVTKCFGGPTRAHRQHYCRGGTDAREGGQACPPFMRAPEPARAKRIHDVVRMPRGARKPMTRRGHPVEVARPSGGRACGSPSG